MSSLSSTGILPFAAEINSISTSLKSGCNRMNNQIAQISSKCGLICVISVFIRVSIHYPSLRGAEGDVAIYILVILSVAKNLQTNHEISNYVRNEQLRNKFKGREDLVDKFVLEITYRAVAVMNGKFINIAFLNAYYFNKICYRITI